MDRRYNVATIYKLVASAEPITKIVQMNTFKKLFILVNILLFLTSCSKEKNHAEINFALENSEVKVENFKICETEFGFQISIEKSLQQKVASQKIKTMFVVNKNTKVEIKTFNILHSPPENFTNKAPTKPNGSLAFFEDGNDLTIEVLSNNKSELINLIGKEYVLKCASY